MKISFQDVYPNSPASIAGLRQNTDYILGAESVLNEVSNLLIFQRKHSTEFLSL